MKRVVKVCHNLAGVVQEPLQEMYSKRLDNKQIPSCQTTQTVSPHSVSLHIY